MYRRGSSYRFTFDFVSTQQRYTVYNSLLYTSYKYVYINTIYGRVDRTRTAAIPIYETGPYIHNV